MTESSLYYFGTNKPVLPGDRIEINRLLRSPIHATVTYVPGISKYDPRNGYDQWSYRVDDGDYYVIGFDPENKNHASKRISLIARASPELKRKYEIFVAPPEIESEESTLKEILMILGVVGLIFLAILGIKVMFS